MNEEVELPLGIHSAVELNIEVILRTDIRVLKELYCRYPVFNKFLKYITNVLVAKNVAPSYITSFEEFYIYKMMRHYRKESMIPLNVIIKYGYEYDDYSLLQHAPKKFKYIHDIVSNNKKRLLEKITERYPHYVDAYNGKFDELNIDNYIGIVYSAIYGGYVNEITKHYLESKMYNYNYTVNYKNRYTY